MCKDTVFSLLDEEQTNYHIASVATSPDLNNIFQELRVASWITDLGNILLYASAGLAKIATERAQTNSYIKEAAHRDLGHIVAIVNKNNIPLESIDGLLDEMFLVSNSIQEVPRDTVFSYGPRNLSGENIRRFTVFDYEVGFIESFRTGMSGIDICLRSLLMIAFNQGNAVTHLENSIKGMQQMTNAIMWVHKNITPNEFTNTLRPFFDPIIINGESFLAPGGAQMPLILVDLLVGGESYLESMQQYSTENVKYMPLPYRLIYNIILEKKLYENIVRKDSNEIKLLEILLKRVLSFRYPHLQVAEENFKLRRDESLGSGGYSPVILKKLIRVHK